MPLSFTAYFWRGTRESWVSVIFELRPVAWQSAVSAGKPRGHTASLACPHRAVPGPWCSFGTLHVLSPWWTLDTRNLGSPRACLECLAEGLWAEYFTGSSFL